MTEDNKNIEYDFWQLCRLARKNAGFTLQQAANESGYTHQNISRFERGESLTINLDILLWYIRNTDIVEMVRYREKKGKKAIV